MLSKYEIVGIGISVLFMAVALYLVRIETNLLTTGTSTAQLASLSEAESGIVVVGEGSDVNNMRESAIREAADAKGNLNKMVIDDIKLGEGKEVEVGDTVEVHYVGTLQDGVEFDSSKKRGVPFSFTVGDGMVIEGWEKGLVGMKVGGQRILVVPPSMGYGDAGIGPIPGDATLVFSIELLAIK
jgi:FKBP-type peptidyl-prolyl cis-trans isomerase FkpA